MILQIVFAESNFIKRFSLVSSTQQSQTPHPHTKVCFRKIVKILDKKTKNQTKNIQFQIQFQGDQDYDPDFDYNHSSNVQKNVLFKRKTIPIEVRFLLLKIFQF